MAKFVEDEGIVVAWSGMAVVTAVVQSGMVGIVELEQRENGGEDMLDI